jgi:predicted naringenin-chalcone synthase
MPDHLRPAILAIDTAVPDYSADQHTIGEWMASSFADRPALQRLIRSLYAYSGIEKRHGCAPEYLLPPTESPYAPGRSLVETPTTAERMAAYRREAPVLAEAAARRVFETLSHDRDTSFEAESAGITHLIVVTCTGFFAPGLDFMLADQLGLSSSVERTVIGFMGCSAAFNGLRAAGQIVAGDPSAKVLVVSVELCSLHIQAGDRRDDLVSAALFADGAGAAIVGMPQQTDTHYFQLDRFQTGMKPATEDEMVWEIGNHGFTLRLSPRIPDHLSDVAPTELAKLMQNERPQFWSIHPGGRAIVDNLQTIFELPDDLLAPTRRVLADFGNLSSATILFVLAEQRRRFMAANIESGNLRPTIGVAMAFGPGLTIEMARLTYVPQAEQAIAIPATNGTASQAPFAREAA